MKATNAPRRALGVALLAAVALALTPVLRVPPGAAEASPAAASYTLDWWTVDGGGTTCCTAGEYTLGGTVGQPDAAVLTGGAYTLAGGFWGGAMAQYRIYLPVVLR